MKTCKLDVLSLKTTTLVYTVQDIRCVYKTMIINTVILLKQHKATEKITTLSDWQ